MSIVTVELCSRTFAYPSECPCCGAEPDSELAVPVKTTERTLLDDTPSEVLFPYCDRCVSHARIWETGSMTSALITLTGIVSGIVVGLSHGSLDGLVVLVGALAVSVFVVSIMQSRARSMCLPSCASGAKAVTYFGWSGSTNAFAFESATYTAQFAEHNVSNLVNVDARLVRLLEAHKIARLQAPTPATATRILPPAFDLKHWVTQLERSQPRVARRITLSRALDVVSDLDDRKALVHVVCHAELSLLFERVEGVAAPTKRRLLQRALSNARVDNLPVELRDAKVQELDRQLRSITYSQS
jgi:hypothetical protein